MRFPPSLKGTLAPHGPFGSNREGGYPSDGSASLLPTGIDAANLLAWHRPDDNAAVTTLVSGKVSALADKSVNARPLLQGTAAARPVWTGVDAAYNNRPTMTFDGAATYLATAGWLSSVPQPITVYLVGQVSGASAYQTLWSNNNGDFLARAHQNSLLLEIYAGTAVLTAGSATAPTPSVMCFVFNGASSAIYLNNATTAVATGTTGTNELGDIRLGMDNTGLWLEGKLADHVVYAGAHSVTLRRQVMSTYMGTRYNISVTP